MLKVALEIVMLLPIPLFETFASASFTSKRRRAPTEDRTAAFPSELTKTASNISCEIKLTRIAFALIAIILR